MVPHLKQPLLREAKYHSVDANFNLQLMLDGV